MYEILTQSLNSTLKSSFQSTLSRLCYWSSERRKENFHKLITLHFVVKELASNTCSFNEGFRHSASKPEVEYNQSEWCTIYLAVWRLFSRNERNFATQIWLFTYSFHLLCSWRYVHEVILIETKICCDPLLNILL